MKKRTRILAAVLAFSMMAMPVSAKEAAVIGDAASWKGQTEEGIQAAEDAVMPEFAAEDMEEVFETADLSSVGCSIEEWAVLYGTNKIRMINGLQPLSVTDKMQKAADVRAQEIQTFLDNTRPNGNDCFTALTEAGASYDVAGENIAAGYADAAEVLDGWWNSEGHRANMLDTDYNHLAVGYGYNENDPNHYYNYWVQMFIGSCTPTSISIEEENAYTYLLERGEDIDDLGLVLKVECKHGTSYMPVISEMCSAYDESKLNEEQTVTVTYGGKTTTFPIYVCEPMPFTDVNDTDWYFDYVANVYYNNIMTGLKPTVFGPADPLVRAQFAVILYRMSGEPAVTYTPKFPDVANEQWYTNAILWASDVGVVTGYSNTGLFGPADNITREQMAVMMYRYAQGLGYDVSEKADFSKFADASSVSSFAREAMQWAVGTGIITGKDNETRIDPQGNANRAECATIITRFLRKY